MKTYSKYSEIALVISFIILYYAILTSYMFIQFYGHFPGYIQDNARYYAVVKEYFSLEIPNFIENYHVHALFVLGNVIHNITGISALDLLNYIFPFLLSLQVLFLYIVVKTLTKSSVASIIASLYLILSPVQIRLAYMHYYKAFLGQLLLLLVLYVGIKFINNKEKRFFLILILLLFIISATHLSEALVAISIFLLSISVYCWNYKKITYQYYIFRSIPIIFLTLILTYIALAFNNYLPKIGPDFFWINLEFQWKNPGVGLISLNEYFFGPEYGGYLAPLISLIIPIIILRKKRNNKALILIQIIYSALFINSALELFFYNRAIPILDLFTAINLGIAICLFLNLPLVARKLAKPYLLKLVPLIFLIIIILPIYHVAIDYTNLNHENEIDYTQLSAYLYLLHYTPKNGTLFTEPNYSPWAYAITEKYTPTCASLNDKNATYLYYNLNKINNTFILKYENPLYFINVKNSKNLIKIFDNGVEVLVYKTS